MSEDKKKIGGEQNGNQRNNQPLTVEDWINRYKEATRFMSDEDRQKLEGYRSSIREGILRAIGNGNLFYYEHLEIRIECYEIELMIKFYREFFSKSPARNAVRNWAKKLANRRKPTWYRSGIRQRESIQAMSGGYIFEYDDSGSIAEIGLDPIVQTLSFSVTRETDCDPEQMLLAKEQRWVIGQFANHLRNSNKKRAPEYLRIYQLQMSGVNVGKQHSALLGIPPDKVKNYKREMIEELRKYVDSLYPEASEQIKVYTEQKGKKWKIEKSTFQDRRELYRQNPDDEDKKTKTIRAWRVLPGGENNPQKPETSTRAARM